MLVFDISSVLAIKPDKTGGSLSFVSFGDAIGIGVSYF